MAIRNRELLKGWGCLGSIQAYESGETTISRVIEMAIEAIELEEK